MSVFCYRAGCSKPPRKGFSIYCSHKCKVAIEDPTTTLRVKLTAAEAEIERLRAELGPIGLEHAMQMVEDAVAFTAERDGLRALLAEAREALEPFAAYADVPDIDGDVLVWINPADANCDDSMATAADCRRARALLARLTPKESEKK